MTGLLVSVRNAQEALIALAGGADLIDVKEPLRGPLGAADGEVWREVSCAVAGAAPISAALGELADADARNPTDLKGFAFAKVGLARCAAEPDWRERWENQLGELPIGVKPVAVVYADWEEAQSPMPREIVDQAAILDCAAVLVDTYDKLGGTLLKHLTPDDLEEIVSHVRRRGMQVVLGGSLDAASFRRVIPLRPDYLAVRRAACRDGRSGTVDVGRVAQLAETLSQAAVRQEV